MAYFINPDGSVSPVDFDYDSTGELQIKKNYELHAPPSIENIGPEVTFKTVWKKSKKKKRETVTPKPQKVKIAKAKNKLRIPTIKEIDGFFERKKKRCEPVSQKVLTLVQEKMEDSLLEYFMECYTQYVNYCAEKRQMEKLRIQEILAKQERKKKRTDKKNKEKAKHTNASSSMNRARHSSGHTIADIAKIITSKGSSSKMNIENSTIMENQRKPKYGYARDRYGRIQERDSLDEERRNEFRQAQKRQYNYDYSNFDVNDDHDGFYTSWD